MSDRENYDVLVLGGGTGGKLVAWTMAKEGKRTAIVERKYIRRVLLEYSVPAQQEHHSYSQGRLAVSTASGVWDSGWHDSCQHGWSLRTKA